MIATSLAIVWVFLPSCEVEMTRNGVHRIRFAVVSYAVLLFDLFALLGVHPVAALAVVVAKCQVHSSSPMTLWHCGNGVIDRFALGFRVARREVDLGTASRS